jgi:uncharacterized cupin superfamily protein
MYYKGSIYDKKFKKETRGYLCGDFNKAIIQTKKMEVAHMDSDLLKVHLGKKPHHHNKIDEMIIVIKGNIEQEVDSKIIKLKKGDFLFIKAKSITRSIKVVTGTEIIVVKSPSIPKDKIDD